jgi:hypothetical protein
MGLKWSPGAERGGGRRVQGAKTRLTKCNLSLQTLCPWMDRVPKAVNLLKNKDRRPDFSPAKAVNILKRNLITTTFQKLEIGVKVVRSEARQIVVGRRHQPQYHFTERAFSYRLARSSLDCGSSSCGLSFSAQALKVGAKRATGACFSQLAGTRNSCRLPTALCLQPVDLLKA